ncbi:MAG TPA: hypothetical protein PL143_08700 [Rhodocyclaceae bacterium]|nr:hypothetical protein [Rhodocyclaceae bacterium]
MSTISNKVRYYHSGMADAPVLSGTAGALIDVLDACLVNGFGVKTINNLTVTDGIAVAHISSGHTFGEGDVLRIAGVTGALAGLNDDWRLASITADTVTWSVEGLNIPGGSASGTVTCLRAPAGWEKVFAEGTTRAAYRSLTHAEHNGLILYVDDSGTTTARARGFKSMTDIDSGTGPFPTDGQISGGMWWAKASNTTGSRKWALAADDRRLTVAPAYTTNVANGDAAPGYAFGRLMAPLSDVWATLISGTSSSSDALNTSVATTASRGLFVIGGASASLIPVYLADGVGESSQCMAMVPSTLQTGVTTFPQRTLSDELIGSAASIKESGHVARGVMPGPTHSWQLLEDVAAPGFTVSGCPGNGVAVIRTQSFHWLLDLGTDGRWD